MRSIGFDLDMTLVDSADGIVASVQHVVAQYGVQADGDEIRSTIGLPLDHVFPRWLPDEPYDVLLAAYRAHYREHGIPLTRPMPGAAEAIATVRSRGEQVLVVTAKYGAVAGLALEAAGLDADVIVGDLFAEGKATALRGPMWATTPATCARPGRRTCTRSSSRRDPRRSRSCTR